MTNAQIKALKASGKWYFKRVFGALWVRVSPAGTKSFYYRAKVNKKIKCKKIADFSPECDIAAALALIKIYEGKAKSFGYYLDKCLNASAASTIISKTRMAHRYLSAFNARGVDTIKKDELINVFLTIKSYSALKRLVSLVSNVYKCALVEEKELSYPLAGFNYRALLPKQKVKHFASVFKDEQIIALFKAYEGLSLKDHLAMMLLHTLVLRPNACFSLQWSQIEADSVCFSAEQMKNHEEFSQPLSTQARLVLDKLAQISNDEFVICSGDARSFSRYLRFKLRKLGVKEQTFTLHGVRSMFSTIANEHDFDPDIIELSLSHKRVGIRAVYDRSRRSQQRLALMQWWGDYLQRLGLFNKILH